MAKRHATTSSFDHRQYRRLGPLGSLVLTLPPVQRAFVRDAMRVSVLAARAREIERTALLTMIDNAFDEIESVEQADAQRAG